MDAHGWNLAEMCQRYHHAIPAAAATQNSSPARDPSAAIAQGLSTAALIDQASPSYSHYTSYLARIGERDDTSMRGSLHSRLETASSTPGAVTPT
ncbi:hypothetical protein ALC53_05071 [Atta colombica]|uniref:Uncharacterized protein n=1 Tax=Atta colombica TaxID=520822 RepID=A0A151I4N2_9HYME|nr:hypothetical protein ALC53_05071 [Atta colombica]